LRLDFRFLYLFFLIAGLLSADFLHAVDGDLDHSSTGSALISVTIPERISLNSKLKELSVSRNKPEELCVQTASSYEQLMVLSSNLGELNLTFTNTSECNHQFSLSDTRETGQSSTVENPHVLVFVLRDN